MIKKKYGVEACNVGDEGGFAPGIQDNNEGADLVTEAIEQVRSPLQHARRRSSHC